VKIGITCYPTFGGSGVVATELGIALADRGNCVHFISYALPSRLSLLHERIRFHEVNVTPYPLFDDYPPYTLALATKMAEVAEYEKLDVLHVHYAIPHAISAFLAKQILQSKLKVVTTLHGTDITLVGRDPSYLPITKFGIEASDGVTAVSESLKRDTIANFNTTKEIEVIPNFVDPDRFKRNGNSARIFVHEGERLLCHVSNFRPVKRVMDVVEIFDRVQKQIPAKLLMIGDGPERSRAEAFCRERGISEKVFFIGHLPNLEDVISGSDVFLLPSVTESFGMAALEALASEVPVIATRAGGLPEVVAEGEVGFLLEVGDVEGMTARAMEILTNPELRERMGKAGRALAESKFSMDRVIPQYVAMYERVLGR
jgi:L-malate glycosyltransferase